MMIRTTMTIAALLAFAALAGCHDGTSASATAADTSITKAPDAAEIQAALSAQVANDYCWSQPDNAHPTWPAPLNPLQFHRESRAVLQALTSGGLLDYAGTGVRVQPTEQGKKDTSWWDAKRGACLGAVDVESVKSVSVNRGNPHAPDGSLDVTYVQQLGAVPAWAKIYFKSYVDLTHPMDEHVTLLKDDKAPGGWRIAGVLVKDASQPTGWREDKVDGS